MAQTGIENTLDKHFNEFNSFISVQFGSWLGIEMPCFLESSLFVDIYHKQTWYLQIPLKLIISQHALKYHTMLFDIMIRQTGYWCKPK